MNNSFLRFILLLIFSVSFAYCSNDSEIETSPQQTTDDFAKSAIQPNRRTSMYGGIGAYSVNARIESDEKEGDIVENINSDLDGNTVPDIDDLSTKYQKPIVVGKCNDFIKTISKNGLNGEETGIALYYILSNLDVKQLPDIYKNNIKNLFN